MKDPLLSLDGKEQLKTALYSMLDFFTKKEFKLMQLVANKGSHKSYFCSRFCFLYF